MNKIILTPDTKKIKGTDTLNTLTQKELKKLKNKNFCIWYNHFLTAIYNINNVDYVISKDSNFEKIILERYKYPF